MMMNSAVSNEKERFIPSPPQFQLEAPKESPFEALPATSATRWQGSLDWNWIDTGIDVGISKVEGILDDILERSRIDVQKFPSNAQVHANYALALLNRGQLNAAADEFSAALGLAPRHFMSLANLARIRTMQEQFGEAESLYERLIADYPKELSPSVNLAYIFLRTGRLENAARILTQAIAIDAEALFPRYLMAISLLTLGKTHEAIRHLRVALRTGMRSPAIHQALGLAYLLSGDPKGAVRSFRTALTLAPEMKDAAHALANALLQHGHTAAVIEFLAPYLEKRPDDTTAREILADAYSRQKQYPAARLQLTTALSHLHNDDESEQKRRAKLLNNIGACFALQGDDDQVERWFTRSIEVDPALDPITYHNLARYYLRKRQFAQASRVLDRCKTQFPRDHVSPEVEAFSLILQERHNEAIDLLRAEVNTGEATAGSYGELGWCLSDFKGDFAVAQEVIQDGLKRYPQNPTLINNLAYAYLMSGRPKEAREVLTTLRVDEERIKVEEKAVLTATWGLLYLWEEDLTTGIRFYEQAEEIARGSLQNDLFPTVRQKMYLELAKYYLRHRDFQAAKTQITFGISIKRGRPVYARALALLEEQVKNYMASEH